MDINEETKTVLHYKDITILSIAANLYLKEMKDAPNREPSERLKYLIDRLGSEMYDPSKKYRPKIKKSGFAKKNI